MSRELFLFMLLINLIVDLVNTTNLSLPVRFNKCCDSDQILVSTQQSVYKCDNITNFKNILPLTVNPSLNVSYGFPTSNDENFTCFDKIYIRALSPVFPVIKLESNTKKSKENTTDFVTTVNKCCPSELSYSFRTKSCVDDASSSVKLIQDKVQDDNVVNINYGWPKCVNIYNESLFSNISAFSIVNGSLILEDLEGQVTGNFARDEYCFETTRRNGFEQFIVVSCGDNVKNTRKQICLEHICAPKCCPFGHYYKEIERKPVCMPEWNVSHLLISNEDVSNEPNNYHILPTPNCPNNRYVAVNFTLQNGTGFLQNSRNAYAPYDNKYCLDYHEKHKKIIAVICFVAAKKKFMKFFLNLTGIIISIIFLCITLCIYFFLPDLKNLHGKIVMAHTTTLLAAYIILSLVTKPMTDYNRQVCKVLGYGILYTFLTAFAWLNVMCFDIWWTFGVIRARGSIAKKKDWKKILLYCLYTFGISFLITMTALIVDLHPDVHPKYKPKIGQDACWFYLQNRVPLEYIIFFLVPTSTWFFCNIVLFILTIKNCLNVRRNIQRMQEADQANKKRFLADKATLLMNIKLFIVMGITWIIEPLSVFFRKPEVLWLILDMVNALQGLWIFLIFVCKENVWKALKKKLGYRVVREGSQHTQSTMLSTKLSTASSSSVKPNGIRKEDNVLLSQMKNRTSVDI